MHRIASSETNVSIHIDNLTAQSGVTRFTEINPNWTYSKDELLKAGDEELHKFEYLLTEVKNKYSPEMRLLQQTHEKIELIECFSNIGVHYTSLLPIKIRTKPCIMIMKRKPNAVLLKRFFDAEEPEDEEGEVQDLLDDDDYDLEEASELEEEVEEPPKLIRRKRLRQATTVTPKLKIKEIIEAEKLEAQVSEQVEEDSVEQEVLSDETLQSEENELKDEDEPSDEKDEKEAKETGSGSIKSSIKRIISQEKTKQLIDELKQLDLSAFCDLNQMDAKECLRKILDE